MLTLAVSPSFDLHFDAAVASGLAVAGLAGLAVGVEREWSGHTTGPAARFAGVRTFLLLGLLGGLAGWLIGEGLKELGVLLLAGGSALTVAAYVMAARRGGDTVEGTTEVAGLVVLALGAVSGLGFPLVTSAVASVMVLALIEKTRIHRAIKHSASASSPQRCNSPCWPSSSCQSCRSVLTALTEAYGRVPCGSLSSSSPR